MAIVDAKERVGTTLAGKYRLDRVLGEGGMGVVYAGHHLRLDRRVAVKFLHPEYSRDASVVARFFSEAQAAARMQHPNVVDVYDIDQAEDGSAYMVLEFLDGESLGDRLKREGPLDRHELVTLLGPVLEALHQAHEQGIVHRDLKPDNIFLSRDRSGAIVPKILDFGIAKLADAQRSGTSTGQVVGTPIYMAPEQAMGRKDIGPWTDIWAMGVVLFELLTGRYPFDFSPEMAFTGILLTIVSTPARSLAEVWPDAPSHLVFALDRALAKDPAQRWPSMKALKAAVEAAPLSQQETAFAPPLQVAHALPRPQPAFPSASSVVLTGTLPHGDARPPQRSLLPWIGAGVALTAGVGVVAAIGLANSAPSNAEPTTTPPVSTAIQPPDASTLTAAAPAPAAPPQVPTAPLHDRHPAEHVVPASTLAHESPPPPAPPVTTALPVPPRVAPHAPETTPTVEADPPQEPSSTPREGTSMRRDPTPTMQGSWGTTVSAEDM